jgi:hypothetical protein
VKVSTPQKCFKTPSLLATMSCRRRCLCGLWNQLSLTADKNVWNAAPSVLKCRRTTLKMFALMTSVLSFCYFVITSLPTLFDLPKCFIKQTFIILPFCLCLKNGHI